MLPTQKAFCMEEWKDIPGYEGLYEASNLGRIRTNANKVTSSARFPVRHWKQRIMKQKYQKRRSNGKKNARVCLWKDGKEKTFLVSRLIAMAWCDGYAEGLTVNHIDGNPENNNASNLEWVTMSDNIRKGFEDGLFSTTKPCIMVMEDGTELHFRSLAAASRYLGMNNGYISNAMKKKHRISKWVRLEGK